MRLNVRGHPGASRGRVAWDGTTLHVWVTERAVEGTANQALVQAVAAHLGVRASAVSIVSGQRSRNKVLEVEGVFAADPGAPS